MLSFTSALILFSVVQSAIMLGLLTTSRGNNVDDLWDGVGRMTTKTAPILAIVLFATTWLVEGFRETLPYYATLFALTALILVNVFEKSKSARAAALLSIVFWHLSIYLGAMPQVDIATGEGTQMDRALALNDHWRFEWAHNPSYNPLPTMAFIRATLARVLNVPWYSYGLVFFLSLAWWIAYDLIIYVLTYTITKSYAASLLAMMFVAITPLTPIHQHPYQWSSNMLWLACLLVIIKMLQDRWWSTRSIATVVLLSLGSYLAHATGISLLILLFTAWIFAIIIEKANTVIKRFVYVEDSSLVALFRKIVPQLFLASAMVFTVRILLPVGTFEYIFPVLRGAVTTLIDILREAFAPSTPTMEGAGHMPLYVRAGVSPVQAYSWVLAVSATISWFVYRVLRKRKVSYIETALILSPLLIVGYAFLGYAVFREPEVYFMNRTSYVFMPLLYPFAALTIIRIARQGRIFAMLVILMVGLGAVIASHDPNISPLQFAALRGREPVPLLKEDIIKAEFIVERIEPYTIDKLTIFSTKLFKTGIYRLVGVGGIWEQVMTCRLEQALHRYIFIENLDYLGKYVEIATVTNYPQKLSTIFNDGETFVSIR